MTSAATVLGALPIAMAAGAESCRGIGWVIVGGITLGKVFTLFHVPAAYKLLARRTCAPHPAAAAAPAE